MNWILEQDLTEADVARYVIEALGGLDYIERFSMSSCKDPDGNPVATIYYVSLCPYCCYLTRHGSHAEGGSSCHSGGGESSWETQGFTECSECTSRLDNMAPDVKSMFVTLAQTQLRILAGAHSRRTAWDRIVGS